MQRDPTIKPNAGPRIRTPIVIAEIFKAIRLSHFHHFDVPKKLSTKFLVIDAICEDFLLSYKDDVLLFYTR